MESAFSIQKLHNCNSIAHCGKAPPCNLIRKEKPNKKQEEKGKSLQYYAI
jgi:hypothetical protein